MNDRTNMAGGRLRVCLLPPADLSSESGSTLYSKAVAAGLAGRGHRVTIVCSVPDHALDAEYVVAPVPLPHPYDDNQGTAGAVFYDCIDITFRALLPHLERGGFDVVHAIYPSFNGLAAGLAATLFRVPAVVSCLGRIVNVAAYLDPRYRAMARATFANSDRVIAANAGIKNRIVEEYGVGERRIEVLPMAVDLKEVLEEARAPRRRDGGPERATEILSVCSCLTEEKGVEDVLKALELLRRHAPGARWRYTVIGPDPVAGEPHLRQLQALSRRLDLGDAVRFLGFVPHAQIAGHLRSADIVVDARRVGNFSSVILEALAAGSAIVGSDVEGNTEFLRDEVNGLLFAQGDPASLARCLERLVNRPELVARLEGAAAEWFEQDGELYQFPSHVRALERVYGAALSASKENIWEAQ